MAMHKWQNDVALIGGSYSKHGSLLSTPELKGKTFREMVMWVTREACESANVDMGDIDAMVVSNTVGGNMKAGISIANTLSDYLGMGGKPVFRVENACTGGAVAVRMAANMVASGECDVVCATAVNCPTVSSKEDLDPIGLTPADRYWFMNTIYTGFDYSYVNPQGTVWNAMQSWWPAYEYALDNDVSLEMLVDVYDKHMYNMRDNAQLNPRAARYGYTFEQEAAEHGFDSVKAYVEASPWVPYPHRKVHEWITTDAASAIIVCRAEDAKKYTQKPIKLGGIAICVNGLGMGKTEYNGRNRLHGLKNAVDIAYKMADLDPSTLGLMTMHDDFGDEVLMYGEAAHYLPKGEGWRYVLDGRTAIDGDKPVNPHGGMSGCGNGNDASGMAEIVECMLQMREEAGARQVKTTPEASVAVTNGAGYSYSATVLQQF